MVLLNVVEGNGNVAEGNGNGVAEFALVEVIHYLATSGFFGYFWIL